MAAHGWPLKLRDPLIDVLGGDARRHEDCGVLQSGKLRASHAQLCASAPDHTHVVYKDFLLHGSSLITT